MSWHFCDPQWNNSNWTLLCRGLGRQLIKKCFLICFKVELLLLIFFLNFVKVFRQASPPTITGPPSTPVSLYYYYTPSILYRFAMGNNKSVIPKVIKKKEFWTNNVFIPLGLPSPLSALNAAVQRSNNNPLVDRPASLHAISSGNGNSLNSTPIRPKPPSSQPTTPSTAATLTPISEAKLLSLPPGKFKK